MVTEAQAAAGVSVDMPYPPMRADGQRRIASLLLVALPIVLVAGLRGDTRDTANYIEAFDATRSFPWPPLAYYEEIGVEWGFGVLSWTLRTAGLGWRALFFAVSALTVFYLDKAAKVAGLRLADVAPFYLGSFFLTQQLMQIRQGLASSIALLIVVQWVTRGLRVRDVVLCGVALAFHTVAALPLAAGLCWHLASVRVRDRAGPAITLFVVVCTFAVARVAMQTEALSALQRIATYAAWDTYNGVRGLASPANVRAVLLLGFLLYARAAASPPRVYDALLVLYASHLGLRFGFYDFEILSGRLATAVGFGEVLLLPLALRATIETRGWRVAIAVIYFAAQASATLVVQVPWLYDDYFTPIHSYRPAG
jgi:hypothetical protein